MLFRICALALIFLSRLRFPRKKSITQIIKERYGIEILKSIRKFEKVDFKLRKARLDLSFLSFCKENYLTPKFLQFKLANRNLHQSSAYKECQQTLLNAEIKEKKSIIDIHNINFIKLKEVIKDQINFIDFVHITTLFLTSNNRLLDKSQTTQDRKIVELCKERVPCNDPDKVIFNFSSIDLTDSDKSLLCKGLDFALIPKKLEYSNYLVDFELFYRDVVNFATSYLDHELIKCKIKDIALTSFKSFKRISQENNLSSEELQSLKKLNENKEIVIQKSDKGKSVVILNKDVYTSRVKTLLSDHTKFEKLKIDPNKELNFIINSELRVKEVLKEIKKKNQIDQEQYFKLCPSGSRFGILYGLAKIHKKVVDGCPPFRPILSAIGTPTYKLAKFFVPILNSITSNEYTIKDSFDFSSDILEQNANLYMASLDIDSLFTNLPLDETIDICIENIFQNKNTVNNFDKNNFRKMLTLATKESYFVFDKNYYKQIDGVGMGSPLGPTLANAFLCHHEKKWLANCPFEFKPVYYKRYVDDIFVLLKSETHLPLFKNYMNSCHQNIKFSSEKENNDILPFLDVKVSRNTNHFVTSVYRKPTFSGVFSHFDSFIPETYKIGLISTLIFRGYNICSQMSKFHEEMCYLRNIFKKNGYSENMFDRCLKTFLNKIYIKKVVEDTVSRKEIYITLPYLGNISLIARTNLQKTARDFLPFAKLHVCFKIPTRLSSQFNFKDKISNEIRSLVSYKFQCSSCNTTYIGKTKRHFKVRVSEHMGVSPLTGKVLKSNNSSTAVRDHMLVCDTKVSYDDFSIIANSSNDFRLKIQESLLIKRDNPHLNKATESLPLILF